MCYNTFKYFFGVKKLDNRYFENVINEMQGFLEENGFAKLEEGSYQNDKLAAFVEYIDERQMFTLNIASVLEDGTLSDKKEVNAWLFDDSQNAKDAEAVGIDFVNTLRDSLGIKLTRTTAASSVELPKASNSDNVTINDFAKKMLDIFPALKDPYKEHIAKYGNFLYLHFFGEHLVPRMKNLFSEGTKKQIKKFYDVYDNAYVKGDRETVNLVVALLCAVAYEDEKIGEVIKETLADNNHFYTSYYNFSKDFKKNKKLFAILVK